MGLHSCKREILWLRPDMVHSHWDPANPHLPHSTRQGIPLCRKQYPKNSFMEPEDLFWAHLPATFNYLLEILMKEISSMENTTKMKVPQSLAGGGTHQLLRQCQRSVLSTPALGTWNCFSIRTGSHRPTWKPTNQPTLAFRSPEKVVKIHQGPANKGGKKMRSCF